MKLACKLKSNKAILIIFYFNQRGGSHENCEIGYMGPLCSACSEKNDEKYSKTKTGKCVPCIFPVANTISFLLFFICFGIFLWIIVESNNRES